MTTKNTLEILLGATFMSAASLAAADITVWHHGGRGDGERDLIAAQIDAWNAANPEMQASLELLPEGSYNEQVAAAALAGDLPDLLDFDGPNYANNVWSGYLAPLNNLVSADVIANLSPSLISQGTYPVDGQLYSLGQFDSGLGIWGNKAILEEAGVRIPTGVADAWSGEEFEAALAALQDLESVTHALDIKMNYGQGEWFSYGFSPIVQSFGGDFINRETWRAEGTLNGEGAVAAMNMVQGLFNNDYIVPASAGDDSFFGQKNAALALVGHWMWGAHNEAHGDNLVLLPMPNFGGKQVTGNGSWTWGITETAEDKAATAALLEFLLQDDNIVALTNANGAVPGTLTAMASTENFAEGGALSLYTEQLQNDIAMPRPAHPAYPVISASFAQAFADIASGADVQETLNKAAAAIDEDIEDNGGYAPFGQ